MIVCRLTVGCSNEKCWQYFAYIRPVLLLVLLMVFLFLLLLLQVPIAIFLQFRFPKAAPIFGDTIAICSHCSRQPVKITRWLRDTSLDALKRFTKGSFFQSSSKKKLSVCLLGFWTPNFGVQSLEIQWKFFNEKLYNKNSALVASASIGWRSLLTRLLIVTEKESTLKIVFCSSMLGPSEARSSKVNSLSVQSLYQTVQISIARYIGQNEFGLLCSR